MEKVTVKDVVKNEYVDQLIARGNEMLGVLGYTEHSKIHAGRVSATAGRILKQLDYPKRQIELARIAGYMHDAGNAVNRHDHAHSGAVLVFQILRDMGMEPAEVAAVVSAVGNHDENTGTAFDPISAALILADKTDVRRDRVRNKDMSTFDIHDRVNYAALSSKLVVDREMKIIQMNLELDDSICCVMDYFEIFLNRMILCKKAAEKLGLHFGLKINGQRVL